MSYFLKPVTDSEGNVTYSIVLTVNEERHVIAKGILSHEEAVATIHRLRKNASRRDMQI